MEVPRVPVPMMASSGPHNSADVAGIAKSACGVAGIGSDSDSCGELE